jgi:hypothetical protein
MKYMAMIFEDEKAAANATQQQQEALFGGYMKFTAEVKASGHYLFGEPLQPTNTATTVRLSPARKAVTTDGPYAETKEQLGGFYIFECKDLDEAIQLASRICAIHTYSPATVEVRPVMPFPE